MSKKKERNTNKKLSNYFLLRDGNPLTEPSKYVLEIILYNIPFVQRVPCHDLSIALNYVNNLLKNDHLYLPSSKSQKSSSYLQAEKLRHDSFKKEKISESKKREDKRKKERERETKRLEKKNDEKE